MPIDTSSAILLGGCTVLFLKTPVIWDVRLVDGILVVSGGQYIHLISLKLKILQAYQLHCCDIYTATMNSKEQVVTGGSSKCLHFLKCEKETSNSGKEYSHVAFPMHGGNIDSIYEENGYIYSCAAAPDGSMIVSKNGIILLLCPRTHEDCVDLVVSGSSIFTVGADGHLKLWHFDADEFYEKHYEKTKIRRTERNIVNMDEYYANESTFEQRALEFSSRKRGQCVDDEILSWNFHTEPTKTEHRAVKQYPLLIKYRPDAAFKLTHPIDSVHEHCGVIVAHGPQLGFVAVYPEMQLQFSCIDSRIQVYKNAVVIGIELPPRDLFWHKARGSAYCIATGGEGKAWSCSFPSREAVLKSHNVQEILSYFELREYVLPNALYRAVIPIDDSEIIACGCGKDHSNVVLAHEFTKLTVHPINVIDDIVWTPQQRAYIRGESLLSWHPGNGVSVCKQ